jgi:hypothetical protein
MKTKTINALLLTLTLNACATYMKDYKARGYSDEDMALIKPYLVQYNRRLIGIGPFGTVGYNPDEEANMKTIFCNCYKTHGELCRKPSSELGNKDKTLWIKSNAAEIALKTQAMGNGPTLDNDECVK